MKCRLCSTITERGAPCNDPEALATHAWSYPAQPRRRESSTGREEAPTLVFRARFSISEMHFLMMKGMPSELLRKACVKSWPKSCSFPWSFLCPHWMARVSRHFLWQAK